MIDTWDIMSTFALGTYFSDKVNVVHPNQQLLNPKFFEGMKVSNVLNMNERTRLIYAFEPTDSILALLKPMGDLGIHRCLVSQRDDSDRHHCWKMISRTDLVKYLLQHEKEFDKLLGMSVDEIGLGFETGFYSAPDKVLICKPTDITLSIYQKYVFKLYLK
jgi:hypothetical protein